MRRCGSLALLVPPLITLGNISCQWNGIWAEEGCLGLLQMNLATRTELLVTLTHTGKRKGAHTKHTRAVFPFPPQQRGSGWEGARGKILDDDCKNPLCFVFINVCDAIKRFFFSPKINIFLFLHTSPRHSVLYNGCQRHQLSLPDIKMGVLSFAGGKRATKQWRGRKMCFQKKNKLFTKLYLFIY